MSLFAKGRAVEESHYTNTAKR